MLDYLIFAVVSVTFLIILVIYLYPGAKKKTTIPGPDPSDVQEGNIPDVIKAGSLFEYLLKLHETYGNICGFYWGEQFVVSIADPTFFEQQIGVFDKSKDLMQMYSPLISGNALQLTNGIQGRKRHKLLASLHGSMLEKLEKKFLKVGWEMNRRWKGLSKDDHVPVSEYMSALAFKALANFCFGDEITDKQIHSLKQQFDIVWNGLESNLLNTNSSKQERIDKTYEKLKVAIQNIGSQKSKVGDHGDLWSALIQECSPESSVNEILAYIAGGYRPFSAWLTWCIYYVASDSVVQNKMRTEISKNVTSAADVSGFKFGNLKYVRQVLNETLRCACVFPWTSRVQNFDSQLGKHLIPKNTPVIHALGVVFQDEQFFPDPECFQPDRMSESSLQSLPSLTFSPFGFAGKRACPATEISYLMAMAWICQIVSSFKIKLVGEEKCCPAAYGLVTRPEEEVWIGLSAVKEDS